MNNKPIPVMQMRPYISLDLETTGLDINQAEVLQIAAVLDDGQSKFEDLERINFIIDHKEISFGETYALGMNAWILQMIKDSADKKETRISVVKPSVAINALYELVCKCSRLAQIYDRDVLGHNPLYPNKKIQIAGKNVKGYDLPILQNFCWNVDDENNPLSKIQHRCLDVGSLYSWYFGQNASLSDINRLIGREEVSHDALDDALDVVSAIRKLPNIIRQVYGNA